MTYTDEYPLYTYDMIHTSDFTLKEYEKLDNGTNIQYKYCEDKIVADFKEYIDKTYGEHYKVETLECFDAWIARGSATTTFIDTAEKYIWRYGKKDGANKKDLMKALHYIVLALYNDHYKE
jgi:hypothetical protein